MADARGAVTGTLNVMVRALHEMLVCIVSAVAASSTRGVVCVREYNKYEKTGSVLRVAYLFGRRK
jgi:hypothetical protein